MTYILMKWEEKEMIADVRRAVAVASYVMVTNRVASSVFDFTNGDYHPMSVSHTGNFLSVYDYQRSNYLSGYLPNLFDYSTASYVNMMMSGNTIMSRRVVTTRIPWHRHS